MRLVVLGASGKVGRLLAAQAMERGHEVTAVVRPDAPYEPPSGVRVVRDEVLRAGALDAVVPGHDAVLSGIGLKRKSQNPWSKLTSPPDLCSASARLLVAAMKAHGIDRVVAVSAAGVGDSAPRMNRVMRALVATSSIGFAYRDLAVMEEVYAGSGLDWCCVRPVTLTDGPLTRQVREVDAFEATMAISRADLAWWMLERLEAGPGSGPRLPQIARRR